MMPLLIYSALGLGGILVASKYQKAHPPSTSTSVGSAPKGTPTYGAQPSQRYPFQNPISPRVDNSNQPWYAGSRAFSVGPGDSYSSAAMATSNVVQSLSDIWGNLSSGDESSNVGGSSDSMPASSVDAPDPVMVDDASNGYSLNVDTSMPDGGDYVSYGEY